MKLEKKYGLSVAVAMVVGIVIGSGVFFKAGPVLSATEGDLKLGILAWVIGGLIMVISAYVFSIMATKINKVNGVVDYMENSFGEKAGYYLGSFMTYVYYPSLVAVLAWLCARYTGVLFNLPNPFTSTEVMVLGMVYLVIIYGVNALAPKIAGHLQVSTTIIKMVPLALVAIVGLIVGLSSGMTIENLTSTTSSIIGSGPGKGLFAALCSTAFAYEGWIIATTINAELKNSNKNLPKALVIGTLIVMGTYILYYVGLAGTLTNNEFITNPDAVNEAMKLLFGNIGAVALTIFVILSCLGTLNGLMMGCTRGIYAISSRGRGPKPELFNQIDNSSNVANNSATIGFIIATLWYGMWFLYLSGFFTNLLGGADMDFSELPILFVYLCYIPMYIKFIITQKDLSVFKRFVMPILAIIGAIVICTAAVVKFKMGILYFFAILLVIGAFAFFTSKKKSIH